MSNLLLPGQPGFKEWLAALPPDWKNHAAAHEGKAFYGADLGTGLLLPLSPRQLDELVFDAGLYGDEGDDWGVE